MRWLITTITLGLALGCARPSWRGTLTETASTQHGCPLEHVSVVGDDGLYSPIFEVDVCGERRVYQNVGRGRFVWMDTTPRTAGAEPVPIVQPQAITASIPVPIGDTPFGASVRAHLDARAAAILVCTGSSVAIEARWGTSGTVELGARGVTDPTVAQCIGAAIGAIEVPEGTAPGQLLHPISG